MFTINSSTCFGPAVSRRGLLASVFGGAISSALWQHFLMSEAHTTAKKLKKSCVLL